MVAEAAAAEVAGVAGVAEAAARGVAAVAEPAAVAELALVAGLAAAAAAAAVSRGDHAVSAKRPRRHFAREMAACGLTRNSGGIRRRARAERATGVLRCFPYQACTLFGDFLDAGDVRRACWPHDR